MNQYNVYLIKPTRYDDDGYPLQWYKSIVPSNSMACVAGIVEDSIDRGILPGVDVKVTILDEVNTLIDPTGIIQDIRQNGGKGFIGLVGVQSNQYPRAIDLAREFRASDLPVCIGGFHVSGIVSMLKEMTPDLVEAQEMGISFFTGEAEDGRMDEVLLDAWNGGLKPIYDHVRNTPNIAGAPIPILSREQIDKNIGQFSTFDLGRGCPFECSFCSIINVQGRKSRFRTADDLEKIIRENAKNGIDRFFLTDDNFARNREWESFLDRLIMLREEGHKLKLAIQVDTLAHRIKGFIEKCVIAGADQIFIGMEAINADSLEYVKKRQNRIEEYQEMFLAWKKYPVVITCGFIIGFPNDTKESILHDIEILKNELPIDTLYINYLTPLPGSEDHKKLHEAGIWMDPDMNKYDLNHRVTHHPTMSDKEWEEAFQEAHRSFYTWEHMETIIKRLVALKSNKRKMTVHRLLAYRESIRLEGVAKLEAGIIRIKRRKQRRYGMPKENPLVFYSKYFGHVISATSRMLITFYRLKRMLKRAMNDPERFNYVDMAIAPINSSLEGEDEGLQLMTDTRTTENAQKRQERALTKA